MTPQQVGKNIVAQNVGCKYTNLVSARAAAAISQFQMNRGTDETAGFLKNHS